MRNEKDQLKCGKCVELTKMFKKMFKREGGGRFCSDECMLDYQYGTEVIDSSKRKQNE